MSIGKERILYSGSAMAPAICPITVAIAGKILLNDVIEWLYKQRQHQGNCHCVQQRTDWHFSQFVSGIHKTSLRHCKKISAKSVRTSKSSWFHAFTSRLLLWLFFLRIYYKRRRRENARKILFDFLENRQYNYEKRAAGKRKTSFPAARFRLLKYSIAIKKCVACQRKSSLYARSTLFYMYSRSLLTKSSTKRFRE